jgi:hypothetical protein
MTLHHLGKGRLLPATGFSTLALMVVGLAGCLPTPTDSTSNTTASQGIDRTREALSQVEPQPEKNVCNGGAFRCFAHVRLDNTGKIKANAVVSGFGPSDLASAYKLDTSANPNRTIAIIDAFGYPNAESDLATYRSQFGLPACTKANGCLKIVNQNGQTSPLPPAPPAGDDWTVETALDLDLASAACPNCKLLLIQADDDLGDGLFIANDTAASLGATVVSNSWGTSGSGYDLTSYETYFNHAGTGYFASSGDSGYDNGGYGASYPASSAHVIAVGGTTLAKATSTSRGWAEAAWSDGGSGCSTFIPKPSWQKDSACSFRAIADVSAVGDPNTGLAVYNKANGGWIVVGGTSASSPFVAGVFALTGHALSGASFIYANANAFFDVSLGTNGSCGNVLCKAGAGWDGPTGMGTPNGAVLQSSSCTPACGSKVCGSDGCGGSCGTCPTGQSCSSAGQCTSTCTPACGSKVCGSDGCGGSCGTCPTGQSCSSAGQCTSTCTPACGSKVCGSDGCGGSCGTCPAGQACSSAGQCTSACTPSCSGKVCGSDGCGGTCGACPSGQTCNTSGQCNASAGCAHPICSSGTKLTSTCDSCAGAICAQDSYCCTVAWDSWCVWEVSFICGQSCGTCSPACGGKVCGDDGCGGSCGTCSTGQSCNSTGQCASPSTCSHAICSAGAKLKSGCDPCATKICALDEWCCNVSWDSICVGEVSSVCGKGC